VKNCKERKHNRITVRDMELAVRNDIELDTLFKKYNIMFLGGGVVPFIHNSFITSAKSIALKNIKKQQKISESLVLAKSPFEKLVRHILKENSSDHSKISKDVFTVLQYFTEQYIIDLLYNANYLTIHAGRIKLIPSDIQLYSSFLNGVRQCGPYVILRIVSVLFGILIYFLICANIIKLMTVYIKKKLLIPENEIISKCSLFIMISILLRSLVENSFMIFSVDNLLFLICYFILIKKLKIST
jgi:histone H3/histone H3-like centromeric protein A